MKKIISGGILLKAYGAYIPSQSFMKEILRLQEGIALFSRTSENGHLAANKVEAFQIGSSVHQSTKNALLGMWDLNKTTLRTEKNTQKNFRKYSCGPPRSSVPRKDRPPCFGE